MSLQISRPSPPVPLNRLEITVAEILRNNAPLSYSDNEGLLWLDLVSDFVDMLSTGKPRFNVDEFYLRCFDGNEMRAITSGI